MKETRKRDGGDTYKSSAGSRSIEKSIKKVMLENLTSNIVGERKCDATPATYESDWRILLLGRNTLG